MAAGALSAALCGVTTTRGCGHSGLERRQRLGLEHVERGGIKLARLQRREDVGIDLQAAAAGIDQHRARQQRGCGRARQLAQERCG